MKEIPITKGYVALIEDESYELVSQFKWHAAEDLRTVYAATRVKKDGKRVTVKMHRLIMGNPLGKVDHINGNGLDNRISNLRVATDSQNACNRRTPTHNKSGFKGVWWHKRYQHWQASISVNGKRKHLGVFDTKEDAARAYNEAAKQHHGEFACLNVV